mgnify:CR=1 FL=1
MLRLGIIGCGNIVKMHVRHIDRTPVKMVCVMDIKEEAARAMAQQLGCEWTTDRASLLARKDVGAVLITHSPSPRSLAASRAS